MHTPSDKSQQPQSQAIANELSEKKGTGEAIKQFVDNRPEAIAQRKLQEMANNSEQVKQLKAYQKMADSFTTTIQLNKENPAKDEEFLHPTTRRKYIITEVKATSIELTPKDGRLKIPIEIPKAELLNWYEATEADNIQSTSATSSAGNGDNTVQPILNVIKLAVINESNCVANGENVCAPAPDKDWDFTRSLGYTVTLSSAVYTVRFHIHYYTKQPVNTVSGGGWVEGIQGSHEDFHTPRWVLHKFPNPS